MTAPDPIMLGLTGLAGSGKDTAADYLCRVHGFERYAFAQPMRDMLEALLASLGLDHAYLFEPALKEQPIPGLGHSYRKLAQTLGTEWGRTQLGADFWLRAADLMLGLPDAPVHDRIVITDVRFPNEAAWVTGHQGVIARIWRRSALPVREHVSEQHVEGITPLYLVDNTDAIDWLHFQLDAIVAQLLDGEA